MSNFDSRTTAGAGTARLPAIALPLIAAAMLVCSGCTAALQTKVSGNLNRLSRNMTVAILPVEITEPGQHEAARLFRQNLFAHFKQSRFNVLERYVVDGLLKQNGLLEPAVFKKVSPIRLGEILGADAVLIGSMTKVEKSYFVIHSSIKLGVTVTMTDTRSGEILWVANQTETDFDGIAKIPTGILSAAYAPIQFLADKMNLDKLTSKMTGKLTELVKNPQRAEKEDRFETPLISRTAALDIHARKNAANPADPQAADEEDPGSFFYTLQVGAYRTRSSAENVFRALAGKGYRAFITLIDKGRELLYKVNVEKFQDKEKAYEYSREFSHRERIDHFVTSVQPG
jgi:hypothetical protein